MKTMIDSLRAIHDLAHDFDWTSHLADVNEGLGLDVDTGFRTVAPGLPPGWFNGDVESIRPGAWTLVVSINPGLNPRSSDWYLRNANASAALWDHWRTYNRDTPRPQSDFFSKLVLVAAGLLGEAERASDVREYATTSMVFVEICPYATRGWPPQSAAGQPVWRNDREQDRFVEGDPGVKFASQVAETLLRQGDPALVLINGKPAIRQFERVHRSNLEWERQEYRSASKASKWLWHMEGTWGAVPVVGFPMLRKARTHNSHLEIDQLIEAGRNLMDRTRMHSSADG